MVRHTRGPSSPPRRSVARCASHPREEALLVQLPLRLRRLRPAPPESSYTAGTGYIITYALWKMVLYM
jgi:hypothetical protein